MRPSGRRHRRSVIYVPVASMGDIAFLLITFFMVCSNFNKDMALQAVLPRSTDIEVLEMNTVTVAIDRDSVLYFQGVEVADAEAVEWAVRAIIAQRVGDKPQAENKDKIILFKCDQNVDKSVFEPVLDAIARGGGIIAAVGEPVNEGF